MVIMSYRTARLFLTVVVVTWNDLSVWCKEMDSKKYFLTPEALTWDEAEEVNCSSSGLKVKNNLFRCYFIHTSDNQKSKQSE